jgi:DNA-binding CsgD family transcriptional regulator
MHGTGPQFRWPAKKAIPLEAIVSPDSISRFTRFIAALARSLKGNDFGTPLLKHLREFFGMKKTAFILLDTESFEAGYPVFQDIPRTAMEKYHESYMEEGIFLRAIMEERKLLSHRLLSVADVMSAESYERSSYYRDIVSQAGAYDAVVIPISGDRRICGGLSVFKPEADGLYTSSEKRILASFHEPLSALFENYLELQKARDELALDSSLLERLGTGVLVVGSDGEVLRANTAALRLCERLYPGDPGLAVAKLVDSLAGRRILGEDRAEAIPRYGGSPIDLRILPFSYITPAQKLAFRSVVYLDERGLDMDRLGIFGARYSLSKRELEIVAYVIEGADNEIIAEKLFLSGNTVRTHLQNIYRKLSINNRISIIQLFRED